MVNSIDAALDPNNYDTMELPTPKKPRTWTAKLGPAKKKDVETIGWTDQQPAPQGRQRRCVCTCDILTGEPGLRSTDARDAETMLDALNLFIDPRTVDEVVAATNRNIEETLQYIPPEQRNDTMAYLRPTDACELCAFIGLMYFRGQLGLNHHSIRTIFSEKAGHQVFEGTMSRNRFSFLSSHLCFDDHTTCAQRWKTDRFVAFCDFFDMLNGNCSRHLGPGKYLSLDETLYPMRNHISFKQYNPSKPPKYGMCCSSP